MSILISVLLVFHVLLCVVMVLVVLMQRPRSEGLGAAFGGGVAENLFGAQTTHVLQKFTVYLGIGFFVLTLLLAILYSKSAAGATKIQRELLATPPEAAAPAAPANPAEPAAQPPPGEAGQAAAPAAETPASPSAPEAEPPAAAPDAAPPAAPVPEPAENPPAAQGSPAD